MQKISITEEFTQNRSKYRKVFDCYQFLKQPQIKILNSKWTKERKKMHNEKMK